MRIATVGVVAVVLGVALLASGTSEMHASPPLRNYITRNDQIILASVLDRAGHLEVLLIQRGQRGIQRGRRGNVAFVRFEDEAPLQVVEGTALLDGRGAA